MSAYDFVSILIVVGIAVVFIRRQRAANRPRQSGRWENRGDDGSVIPVTSGALEPRVERDAHRRGDDSGAGYPVDSGPGHSHGSSGSWGHGHGGDGGGDGGGGGGGGD